MELKNPTSSRLSSLLLHHLTTLHFVRRITTGGAQLKPTRARITSSFSSFHRIFCRARVELSFVESEKIAEWELFAIVSKAGTIVGTWRVPVYDVDFIGTYVFQ